MPKEISHAFEQVFCNLSFDLQYLTQFVSLQPYYSQTQVMYTPDFDF